MYCASCGSQSPPGARFCGKCGTPVATSNDTGRSISPARRATVLVFLIFCSALVLYLTVKLVDRSGEQPNQHPQQTTRSSTTSVGGRKPTEPKVSSTSVEIDIKSIALRSRSHVRQILGSPDEVDIDPSANMEYYSWGFVAYERGLASTVDYSFKTKPASVGEALEKVGLNQTSKPARGPLSYYWNSTTGPLVCCGFEFDNVVILANFSGIVVGVSRRTRAK